MFFFSSRRRHTRCGRDWSSDVCSSDLDNEGKDTLWVRVYYSEFETEEINLNLKKVYSILHSDGTDTILPYLNIDSVDFCTFGNSKPFRIKVRNILNDNYIYFYVKKADASRIYGLELEDILSPNHRSEERRVGKEWYSWWLRGREKNDG